MSTKLLFEMIQDNKENSHLEVMKKELHWCDDFIEIKCIGINSAKKYLFRLSTALISVMVQKYYFNLNELWRLLVNSAQIYVDRVLFSIQHIQVFPLKKDSQRRDAYFIYKTSKYDEKGEPWNIEFLTNLVEPFDLEIQVQLSAYWERRHYYRIEAFLLKSYFERYCLEKYATPLIVANTRKSIDFSQFPKETNYMLEAFVEEIIFDPESDEIYVKSIEMLRLEDYLDRSKLKHHSALARQEFVLHQQMAEQEKEKENSFAPTDTAASENVVEKNLGNLHQEGVTLLQDRGSPSKEEEDLPTLPRSLSVVTTEPQPPPLEKYANLSTLASDGIEKLRAFTGSARHRFSRKDSGMTSKEEEDSSAKEITSSNDEKINPKSAEALIQFEQQRRNKMSTFEQFLTTFSTSPKRIQEIDEKINLIYQENYQAILNTLDEMNLLINQPLEDYKQYFKKQQESENSLSINKRALSPSSSPRNQSHTPFTSPSNSTTQNNNNKNKKEEAMTEEDMKKFIIKEALSIKPEARSIMSTRIIMDYLKFGSNLGKYLNYCSTDDIQCLANECILLEANENTILDTLQIVQNDPIDNIYILISGDLTAKAIPTANGDKAPKPAARQMPQFENQNSQDPFASPSRSRNGRASIRFGSLLGAETWKFNAGDILGENIFTGGLVWDYTLQPPIPLVKEAKFQPISQSRRTLLYQPHSARNLNQNPHDAASILENAPSSVANTPQKQFLICKLPFISCQRYIGRKDEKICEEFLTLFWKELKVYLDIISYNEMILQQSLNNAINKEIQPFLYQLEMIRNQFYHNLTPINLISSGRIRTYQTGMDIFTQGKLRHHMFIMKQGSATYYRLFPKEIIGNDIIPEKIETVMNRNATGTLLSNDFSLFDSEDITILDKIEELDNHFLKMISYSLQHRQEADEEKQASKLPIAPVQKEQPKTREEIKTPNIPPRSLFSQSTDPLHFGVSSSSASRSFSLSHSTDQEEVVNKEKVQEQHKYSNEKLFEYHQRKFHRFQNYKNSLIANTRCEVIVIELAEIVKSFPLLKKLIEITNQKYPQLLISNEEIIYDYYREFFWKKDRLLYLKVIQEDRLNKKLNENFHHALWNNENDQLYRQRQPNQSNLPSSSTSTTGNSTTVSRPVTAATSRAVSRPSTAITREAVTETKGNSLPDKEEGKDEAKQRKEDLLSKEMIKFNYQKHFSVILNEIGQMSQQSDQLFQALLASDQHHHRHHPPHPHKLAFKSASFNSSSSRDIMKSKSKSASSSIGDLDETVLSSPASRVTVQSKNKKNVKISKSKLEVNPEEDEEKSIAHSSDAPTEEKIQVGRAPVSHTSPNRPRSAVPSRARSFTNKSRITKPTKKLSVIPMRPPSPVKASTTLSEDTEDFINQSDKSGPTSPTTRPSSAPSIDPLSYSSSPSSSPIESFRRKAVDIHLSNVHDIRIETEKFRGQRPSSSPVRGEKGAMMIDHLWQAHSPNRGRSRSSSPGRQAFNTDLLAAPQRKTPDDYVQLYRERISEDPKQRFLDEFIHKKYL